MMKMMYWKFQLLFLVVGTISLSKSVEPECNSYQVISDETRSIDYVSGSPQCDHNMPPGWYRFMGKGGSQFPEGPVVNNYNGQWRCQTHAISWLTTAHPRFGEGKVPRTLCYAWNGNKCFNGPSSIFVINCGSYFVYYLQAPAFCRFRYCTNATTPEQDRNTVVNCQNNYMEILLSRHSFNVSKYETITLKNRQCVASINSTYIIMGSALNACGAIRRETSTHIIYTNEATLRVKQESSLITRDHDVIISFSCAYKKDGLTSGASFTPVRSIVANESSIGSFKFGLEMHQDSSFNRAYASYPIIVQLKDQLFFQVNASVEDNGLVLLIDKCYSTPNMNRNDHRKYTFIENGCPTDNTVRFHAADRRKQRFSIQAFRYFNNLTTVYIHCLVLLCQKSSSDSRCTSGCSGNNIHRAKREITGESTTNNGKKSYSEYYVLDEGPMVLSDGKGTTDTTSSNGPLNATIIGLIVGVAALAVIVALLVIRMKCKKRVGDISSKAIVTGNATNKDVFANDEEVGEKKNGVVM